MDILFKTKKLARCCSQERVMIRTLGVIGARKLKTVSELIWTVAIGWLSKRPRIHRRNCRMVGWIGAG